VSPVRKFAVQSRLSKLALGQGGITVVEALKRATLALEEIRPPCLAMMDDCLQDIDKRFGSAAAGRGEEPLADLYALSSSLIDVAGALPNSGIDQAANALCELVDLSMGAGRTSWVAVDVHIRALHLLRAHGASLSAERRQAVIGGLRDVVAKRFGSSTPI
jgi:hypothetical protein